MKRKIININQELCNGCGICASACHEGAIGMADGKAVLLKDDYCDGLGDCLPACPTGAITFEEREAAPYDKQATAARLEELGRPPLAENPMSQLKQWPVQIKLAPVSAPYFHGANLLIAADCTPFAYAGFHNHFMKDHTVLIGCPKLDNVDYSEKLTEIFKQNKIKTITVVRMEVPCCGGIEYAVKTALERCGRNIPWRVVVITTKGELF